jgi:hypothetical protein
MKGNETMQNNILKKAPLFISIFIVLTMACDLSVSVAPSTNSAPLPTNTIVLASSSPTAIPGSATALPATVVPSATVPPIAGEHVSAGRLSLALAPELAGGLHVNQLPRVDGPDTAPWQRTPGHAQVMLDSYRLQGKIHQPQILIYPAQGYAELIPAAFESMHRLNNILGGLPITSDQLPTIPSFTATQVFASNIQIIPFQNGRGVRFLTEYAQYPAPANNNELFYHFQGLTDDGAYYVIAILPITVPMLPETSDPGAVLPTGGVPYPDFADPQADMQLYYASVLDVLNATSSELFTPTLDQLDALIQSIKITP